MIGVIIPVRCFSCGAPVAAHYEKYKELVKSGKTKKEAMDAIGVKRYCCRRMLLAQVELLPTISKFRKG